MSQDFQGVLQNCNEETMSKEQNVDDGFDSSLLETEFSDCDFDINPSDRNSQGSRNIVIDSSSNKERNAACCKHTGNSNSQAAMDSLSDILFENECKKCGYTTMTKNSNTVYKIESDCNTNSKNGTLKENVIVNETSQEKGIINNTKKHNCHHHRGYFASIEESDENSLTPKTPDQNDKYNYISLSDDEGYAQLAEVATKKSCIAIAKKSLCDEHIGNKKGLHKKGYNAIVSATVMVKSNLNLNPFKKGKEEFNYGNKSKKVFKYGFLKRTSLDANKGCKSGSNKAITRHADGGIKNGQLPKFFTKLCIHVPDTATKY